MSYSSYNIDIKILQEIILTGMCNKVWFCSKRITINNTLEYSHSHTCLLKTKGYCKQYSDLNGVTTLRPSNYRQIAFELLKEIDPYNADSFIFEEFL